MKKILDHLKMLGIESRIFYIQGRQGAVSRFFPKYNAKGLSGTTASIFEVPVRKADRKTLAMREMRIVALCRKCEICLHSIMQSWGNVSLSSSFEAA